jgi:putative membrane protein
MAAQEDKPFLSEDERQRIMDAVRKAERTTSAEIVPVIVTKSHRYARAEMVAASAYSLLPALILAYLYGHESLWSFLVVYIVLFFLAHAVVRRVPRLKLPFISSSESTELVKEAAETAFSIHGLGKTRSRNGVMLYISTFERAVWVMPDREAAKRIDKKKWEEIVQVITRGVSKGRAGEAIIEAVVECADLLAPHFPPKPDDRNELKDLIEE